MKKYKLTLITTFLVLLFLFIIFENSINGYMNWRKLEKSGDIQSFHYIMNDTSPTDYRYWKALHYSAFYEIEPQLTAQKLLFLSHSYTLDDIQKKFLTKYFYINRIDNFPLIYCTDWTQSNNRDFINRLKDIYLKKSNLQQISCSNKEDFIEEIPLYGK